MYKSLRNEISFKIQVVLNYAAMLQYFFAAVAKVCSDSVYSVFFFFFLPTLFIIVFCRFEFVWYSLINVFHTGSVQLDVG